VRLLQITWRDAISSQNNGWTSKEEMSKQRCPLVRSVGWELKRTHTEVTLVASVVDDGDVGSDVSIPLGMIVSERELVSKRGGK
jgi:hypothetical protein